MSASIDLHPGLNVIGFLRGELGLGEIARKFVSAAEHAGIPTSTVTYDRLGHRQEHEFEDRGPGDAPYDTNLICANAAQLPALRDDLGADVLAGRYTIGVWFWEIPHFPANCRDSFDLVDEVWVASEFTRAAVAAEATKPVHVAPIPLEPPPAPALGRDALGLEDGFLFLFVFDYYSVNARKNPIGLVEAFKRAFAPNEGPRLLVKSVNGEHRRDALRRLQAAAAGRSDIGIVDGYLSAHERDALIAACDCYVSLHRSEGLGLTMAEAMSLAKPVIATGYSGNLTFMDEQNSYLVRHGFTTTPPGCEPYVPGVEWAEPDLDHAAELMRWVYDHPEEARTVGERARRDLVEKHSLERTGEFMRRRLEEIPERERMELKARGPVDRAAWAAQRHPGASLVSANASRITRVLRAFLRRLLWPELASQRQLDADLADAAQALIEELKTMSARLEALERALAERSDRAAG